MKRKFPQIFLDIQIGSTPAGRIVFELYTDITPKTAENFRGLCTGEYGNVGMGKKTKKLHYLNTPIHRIVDGMCIQGGDIVNGDGTSGASIYGGPFQDENFQRRHACAGLLSMANRGRNTNLSQFFITLKSCPHLDGKHVVFGQVIDGIEVVRKIGASRVDMQDRPVLPIIITHCGEMNDAKKHWKFDPFNKALIDEYKEKKWNLTIDESSEEEEEIEEAEEGEDKGPDEGEVKEKEEQHKQMSQAHVDKMDELRQRIQHAKVLNDKAVLQEEKLNVDPKFNEKYKRVVQKQKWEQQEKELEFKGIDKEQAYLNKGVFQRTDYDNDFDLRKKKTQSFGWDVFNDDAVYNAYKKRCTGLVKNPQLYEAQMKSDKTEIPQPTEEALDRLAGDIQKQVQKRKNFSRRRMFVEDEAVTYINERNRIFNRKLQRNFGAYAADIKSNLERGTAH